ncbi:MAG: hypothetical protein JXR86_10025 [Spirochaetales bacterium]|nr:hypothetical protein [Spirochaetales bacterium]
MIAGPSFAPVTGSLIESGIEIGFRGNSYSVSWPADVWQAVPEITRQLLLDNLVFAAAMHLPMKIRDLKGLVFSTGRPFLEPFFRQNFIGDIPSCCDMDGFSTAEEIERFLGLDFRFSGSAPALPSPWPVPADSVPGEKAIVPLSFGKDSLLTYAVAEEIGLEPVPVFVDEPGFSRERMHKEILAAAFLKEFGVELKILEHSTGLLRDDLHLGTDKNEYGWGLQSTEYALMMLPYARACGGDYIFFGNEQSAGSFYGDSTGRWTVYPCYDQTHMWTTHINSMTSLLTAERPVRTGSLIEPLMDMMIQRMIVNRYPRYASYQMSCFAENEGGRDNRWCHDCSICAKMYLMCIGGAVDPAAIGLTGPLLTEENSRYFALFGGSTEFPYARTDLARDEQLFAFHCAARFGSQEPLVERFRHSPLMAEAEERKKELFERFVSLYPSISIPGELKEKVLKIYKEEISGFIRQYEES